MLGFTAFNTNLPAISALFSCLGFAVRRAAEGQLRSQIKQGLREFRGHLTYLPLILSSINK
jgi:hypothetical protein